jgi:hypothetical protein
VITRPKEKEWVQKNWGWQVVHTSAEIRYYVPGFLNEITVEIRHFSKFSAGGKKAEQGVEE